MRRWHEDVAVMARQTRTYASDRGGEPVPLGRLRKHHARDCGRPRCGLCHPSKRWHAGGDRARAKNAWRRDQAA